jgi:hypothetical protein
MVLTPVIFSIWRKLSEIGFDPALKEVSAGGCLNA